MEVTFGSGDGSCRQAGIAPRPPDSPSLATGLIGSFCTVTDIQRAVTRRSSRVRTDAWRSRRAHSGGATRRSEIFSGYTVGFSSSTHRSHQKPLHVLIGSPLTIYEGGAVARTGSGGATMRTRNAVLAYPHGRRRQQFSPASV